MENIELIEPPVIFQAADQRVINDCLRAFAERVTVFTILRDTGDSLTINGLHDKKGLEIVSSFRKKIKVARIEIQKDIKMICNLFSKYIKQIKELEDQLIGIIEPTEQRLLEMEQDIEAQHESIRRASIAAQEAIIQDRINKLARFGFAIELAEIKDCSNEDFDLLLQLAESEHLIEEAEKAEVQRLAEVEADRILDERIELAALKVAAAKAQQIIDDNNYRIELEQKKKEAKIEAAQRKIKAEQLEIQQQKDQAAAEEADRLNLIALAKHEAERLVKLEADAAAEKLRLEALLPDKAKLQLFSESLSLIGFPTVQNEKSQLIVNEIKTRISDMQAFILKFTNLL